MSSSTLSRRRFIVAGGGLALTEIVSAIAQAETISGASKPHRSTALLIGNWSYKKAPSLNSPSVDVASLAKALRSCNFDDPKLLTNCSVDAAEVAIAKFAEEARTSRIALFYYSGHGIQIDGKNYGVPVDFNPDRAIIEAESEGWNLIDLDWAQTAIGRAGSAGIMVVDACRENPFINRLSKANPYRKFKKGLAPPEQPKEFFLVSYATAANALAKDGPPGQNSLYTGTLLKYITDSSLTVDRLFRTVKTAVCDASAPGVLPGGTTDASCQRPETISSIGEELIYLVPPKGDANDTNSNKIVSLGLANLNDRIVSDYLDLSLSGLRFNYLMLKPDGKHPVTRIIPDLPLFTSADRRASPLIIAGSGGYYEPSEAAGGWGLSYPVLDLVVRTTSPQALTVKSIKVQTRASREDPSPYFDLFAEALEPFSLTVINQSWEKLKQVELAFDLVGRRNIAADDAREFADKEMPTSLPLKASISGVDLSERISLFDAIRSRFPEADFFRFLQNHQVELRGRGSVTARAYDKSGSPSGPKVKLPDGFADWYKKLKSEFDSFDMGPLWIAGKATATSETGSTLMTDFMAPICVYNYGVGGGSIEFDLKEFIALPINGTDFVVDYPVNKTLNIDKQTFRGLYPLVTKRSAFMDLNVSVIDGQNNSIFSTGWMQLHTVISRNDRAAAIAANGKVAEKI